ncbi:GNAT family protein [Bacillus pinisoli]|uniref:GNAT family N-acetyltransferase n=1 Tax=Bacillus pinisoli TaxID=2901866 RepID=UPI00300E03F8
MDLNRVEIRVADENIKSRAIPERLGFINEGKVQNAEWLYDHYVDHIIYSKLRED